MFVLVYKFNTMFKNKPNPKSTCNHPNNQPQTSMHFKARVFILSHLRLWLSQQHNTCQGILHDHVVPPSRSSCLAN